MPRTIYILIVLTAVFNLEGMGQDSVYNLNVMPSSPAAAGIIKDVLMPMTIYEGTPSVSVPVYNITTPKLSLPVSLSYNYNGYKPQENASDIGLGWNINAGGEITRVPQGQVDESSWLDPNNTIFGTYNNHWEDCPDFTAILQSQTNTQDFLTQVAGGLIDTQPDLYIFNFNGYSGKFILVKGKAYLMPYQDLQITGTPQTGFTIIIPDGTSYYFSGFEVTTPQQHPLNNLQTPPYNSGWMLTSITSSDGSDGISFGYTTQDLYITHLGSETFTVIGNESGLGPFPSNQFTQSAFSGGAIVSAIVLSDIYARNLHIHFTADTVTRKDISFGHPIKSIQVTNSAGQLLRNIGLSYTYFGDTSNYECQLKLNQVSIIGGTDTAHEEIYSFGYTTPDYGAVPFSGTLGIDSWGYYNGQDNASLYDCSVINLSSQQSFPGCGIRTVDSVYSGICMLDKVVYPTKGFATFSWGQNYVGTSGIQYIYSPQFTNLNTYYASGSSGTISTQSSFSLNYPQVINIQYSRSVSGTPEKSYLVILKIYNSSDAVVYQSIPFANPAMMTQTTATDTLTLPAGNYTYDVYCDNTCLSTAAQIKYQQQTTEAIQGSPGPGLRVNQVNFYDYADSVHPVLTQLYQYVNPGGVSSGTVLNAPQYGENSTSFLTFTNNSYDNYNQTVYSSDFNSIPNALEGQQFFYQKVTVINHDSTGNGKTDYYYTSVGNDVTGVYLYKQVDYKNVNGALVPDKLTDYNYQDSSVAVFTAVTPQLSEQSNLNLDIYGSIPPAPAFDTLAFRGKLYTSTQYSLWSAWRYLASSDQYTYDESGLNPVGVHTSYFYKSPNHLQLTEQIQNDSRGDSIITFYKYPLDYPITSCSTMSVVEKNFYSQKQNNINSYDSCDLVRYGACVAANGNPATIKTAIKASPCEAEYITNFTTTTVARDTAFNRCTECLNAAIEGGTFSGSQNAILVMQRNHMVSEPVEKISVLQRNGVQYLISAQKTQYLPNTFKSVEPDTIWQTELSSSTLYSAFTANPTSYYKPEEFYIYDAYGNLATEYSVNQYHKSFIWDYNHGLPIASVQNADTADIAFTSFEADGSGNWIIIDTTRNRSSALSGTQSFQLKTSNSISKGGLNTTKQYIVSYWSLNGEQSVSGTSSVITGSSVNGWTYYEHTLTAAVSSVTVTGTGIIDELRLYPTLAQMVSYTYNPAVGATSECSANNIFNFYQYDGLGRLNGVLDQNGNVVKTYQYNYKK